MKTTFFQNIKSLFVKLLEMSKPRANPADSKRLSIDGQLKLIQYVQPIRWLYDKEDDNYLNQQRREKSNVNVYQEYRKKTLDNTIAHRHLQLQRLYQNHP